MSERIYVGYLPLTKTDRRFVNFGLALLLVIVASGAFMSAASQRSPGPAHWDLDKLTTITGTVRLDGAARIVSGSGSGTVTWFVVMPGKVGASQSLRNFNGQRVSIEGYTLTRSGDRMLELAREPRLAPVNAESDAESAPAPSARAPIGEAVLRGEIVDFKCYLGSMKPGDGRTHKACATLCIMGGVTAAMIDQSSGEAPRTFILKTADGGPLPQSLIQRIGEPVEVRGIVEREGDFEWLVIDDRSVRRAAAAERWSLLLDAVCGATPYSLLDSVHCCPSGGMPGTFGAGRAASIARLGQP